MPIISSADNFSKLKMLGQMCVSDNFSIETLAPGDMVIVPDSTSLGIRASSNHLLLIWDVVSLATLPNLVNAYLDNTSKNSSHKYCMEELFYEPNNAKRLRQTAKRLKISPSDLPLLLTAKLPLVANACQKHPVLNVVHNSTPGQGLCTGCARVFYRYWCTCNTKGCNARLCVYCVHSAMHKHVMTCNYGFPQSGK
jgi:hypothetical protein